MYQCAFTIFCNNILLSIVHKCLQTVFISCTESPCPGIINWCFVNETHKQQFPLKPKKTAVNNHKYSLHKFSRALPLLTSGFKQASSYKQILNVFTILIFFYKTDVLSISILLTPLSDRIGYVLVSSLHLI